MVTTYENIRDGDGNYIKGRAYLFINKVREDGEILGSLSGRAIVPEGSGTLLVIDDWLIPQIDKLMFIDGELVIKEGETIEEPEKTAEEIEREQLLARLAELDGA